MSHFIDNNSHVSFFGRPYFELLMCFGLQESDLLGKSVLECPSGPSSFVAEAVGKGINAVGIDPLFDRTPDAIRALALADFKSMFERVRLGSARFSRRTYQSIDHAERARRAGLERFLADYSLAYANGRYRVGSLPHLEFRNRSFDLVLCGHLLFIYSKQFDLSFHREAIVELCRVAKKEVRIHPIVDSSNAPYPHLDELRDLGRSLDFESRIQSVNHEFFKGTNRTLILSRTG